MSQGRTGFVHLYCTVIICSVITGLVHLHCAGVAGVRPEEPAPVRILEDEGEEPGKEPDGDMMTSSLSSSSSSLSSPGGVDDALLVSGAPAAAVHCITQPLNELK